MASLKVLLRVGKASCEIGKPSLKGLRNSCYRRYLEEKSHGSAQCCFVSLDEAQERLSASRISGTRQPLGSIAIVGAGIAGLHAGLLLQEVIQKELPGTKVTIFDANHEEGGRLFSHHFSGNESVYCEIGGMRLPDASLHHRLHELLGYLKSKAPVLKPTGHEVEEVDYVFSNPNGRVLVNGKRAPGGRVLTKAEADTLAKKTGAVGLGFTGNIPSNGQTADDLIGGVMQPFLERLKDGNAKGGEEGLWNAFKEIADQYDKYSLRQFLQVEKGWNEDMISYVETMTDQTNAFNVSFMEQLMDFYEFDSATWTTIKGGLQRIPAACRQLLQLNGIEFKFNTRVTELSQDPATSKVSLKGTVTKPRTWAQKLHLPTKHNGNNNHDSDHGGITCSGSREVDLGTYDKVLLALPPIAVRMIKTPDSWSLLKRQAIRSLRYDPIRKIGLLFKTRWWENEEVMQQQPIKGGQSITDLPSRWIVYPSNDIGSTGKGALLCYCWSNDAYALLSLTDEEKVEQALKDVEAVHGHVVREQFLEAFPYEWSLSYAGSIAFFAPGQWERYYAAMWKPEGNVYFAGEHLSVHHAWIEGALESAHQAVVQMYHDQCLAQHDAVAHRDVVPAAAVAPFAPAGVMPTVGEGQLARVLRENPLAALA